MRIDTSNTTPLSDSTQAGSMTAPAGKLTQATPEITPKTFPASGNLKSLLRPGNAAGDLESRLRPGNAAGDLKSHLSPANAAGDLKSQLRSGNAAGDLSQHLKSPVADANGIYTDPSLPGRFFAQVDGKMVEVTNFDPKTQTWQMLDPQTGQPGATLSRNQQGQWEASQDAKGQPSSQGGAQQGGAQPGPSSGQGGAQPGASSGHGGGAPQSRSPSSPTRGGSGTSQEEPLSSSPKSTINAQSSKPIQAFANSKQNASSDLSRHLDKLTGKSTEQVASGTGSVSSFVNNLGQTSSASLQEHINTAQSSITNAAASNGAASALKTEDLISALADTAKGPSPAYVPTIEATNDARLGAVEGAGIDKTAES
jgi:hypothetical protein